MSDSNTPPTAPSCAAGAVAASTGPPTASTAPRGGPVPRFSAHHGLWIVVVAGVLAAFALLNSPTIATALWLSAWILLVMIVVGILARLHQTDAPRAVTS